LRRAADALDDEIRRRPVREIVLGGPDDAVAELKRLVHPTTTALVVGRVGVRVGADAAEITPAARAIAERAERQREAALVEEMRQRAAGRHGAVLGLRAALDVLAQRRVATLLVCYGFTAPGGRCPACGHVGLDVRQCPACGTTNVELEDIVEVAIEEAITQGAAVEFCRGTELDRFGSVAALERY
jgi:peptide chain release factor subunit 1